MNIRRHVERLQGSLPDQPNRCMYLEADLFRHALSLVCQDHRVAVTAPLLSGVLPQLKLLFEGMSGGGGWYLV